ncbi:MAG: hypothetical protein HGA71_08165 [Azonexaceae bacterium]|nr:hypothetical protein [Azonexaceae bacterium]
MLKVIVVIMALIGSYSGKELGDALLKHLPSIPSPTEAGQMVKEWKQGGKGDEKISREERARLQKERDIQKQEAVARRKESSREAALALQDRIEAAKRQRYEQQANSGNEYVVPRQAVVAPVRQVARAQPVQDSPKAFARIRDIEDENPQPMRLAAAPVVQCRHNVGGMIDLSGNLRCN